MEMINDLITKLEPSHEQNNFQDFEKTMSEVFEKVEDEDWVKKHHHHLNLRSTLSVALDDTMKNNQDLTPDLLRKMHDEKEKYRSQVKEYTSYLIGRKIS